MAKNSSVPPKSSQSIAGAAYSYMALVPVIQPPVIKLLTTMLINWFFSE